jgi:hypothetical protein
MIDALIKSPALKAGFIYVLGGLGFAIGNLLFARALSPADFAGIALVLAVVQLSRSLGPLGADTVVNRNTVDPSAYLLQRVCLSSGVVAAAAAVLGWQFYDLPAAVAVLTAVICAAAGINLVGSAFFRSRGRYGLALGLTQGHNGILALAAIVSLGTQEVSLLLPLAIIGVAYVASGIVAWAGAFRLERRDDAMPVHTFPWREGRTILATTIAVLILLQLERLAIPQLLDKEALATFAVLAAVAGSPFRVMQMGVGYTLVPQLRQASSATEIGGILRSEVRVVLVLAGSACIVIWFITQPFVDWFLQGKYEISQLMVVAALVSGLAKTVASFGSATVTALGTASDLSRLRLSAWFAVGVALAGAVAGAAFGLVGVLFGVSAGWLSHALWSSVLAGRVIPPGDT